MHMRPTNNPRKYEKVVDSADKYYWLQDRMHGAGHGIEECIPLVARFPLLDADQTHDARPSLWLLSFRNASVIVRFLYEQNGGNQTQSMQESG